MLSTNVDYESLLSELGRGLRPNAIRKLTKLLGSREVISLAAGAPSIDTLPLAQLSEIAARVIREQGRSALQYGPTRGQAALVEAVAGILNSRGIAGATPAEVVMTSGSQQGLDLISRVLIDRGDVVIVELPSYIGGIIALRNGGADLVGVQQDRDGLVIGELESTLRRLRSDGRRVKCIYTIPNFQNPSGVTLSMERRRQLVEVAEEFDLLIIEDDAYFDLYFDEEARLTPLAALCPERVFYLGTFSKVLAPGLRTAYVCAPERLSARIELAKEGADLSSSVLDQAIVMEAIREGLIENRLAELRRFYEVRRVAMLEALERFAPAGSGWTKPAGGFFILMHLAEGIDAGQRLERAIANGVAYVPGESFFVDGTGQNTLRLAYSKESPEKIADGVDRMCRVLAE